MSKHYTPQELIEGFLELHTLPEVYFRIKGVVDNPTSQATDLVRELGNDPALTARVLKVVNSPLYRAGGKVETLLKAVNVLGTRAIHDLVLATAVTGMITRRNLGELDVQAHWRTSLAIAMLARRIGESLRLADRDRLFIEGLLCRLGQLVMYERIGAVVSVIARHAAAKQLPPQIAQRNFLGCHYGAVGAALMRRWQLPASICDAIEHHLEPATANEATDVGLLRLATALVPYVENPESDTVLDETLAALLPAVLPFDGEQARTAIRSVSDDLATVEQLFLQGARSAA